MLNINRTYDSKIAGDFFGLSVFQAKEGIETMEMIQVVSEYTNFI